MNTLKFKAYYEGGSRYSDDFLQHGETRNKDLSVFFNHYAHGDIVQFIGLQDRNGLDIYEGDIVKSLAGNGLTKTGELEKVSEMNGNGCHPFIAYPEYNAWDNNECIVIGNIYENPELIWIETSNDTEVKFISGTVKNPVHTYEEAKKLAREIEVLINEKDDDEL